MDNKNNTGRFLAGGKPWNYGVSGYKINYPENRKLKKTLSNTHKQNIKNGVLSGNNHPNWKGGIYPENEKIRHSTEYKVWRTSVFKRDDYTCQICSISGCELNADHIKSFSMFPELRFELSNGRTLCVECHRQTPTFGGSSRKSATALGLLK